MAKSWLEPHRFRSRKHFEILTRDNFRCTQCNSSKTLNICALESGVGRVRSTSDISKYTTLCRSCVVLRSMGSSHEKRKAELLNIAKLYSTLGTMAKVAKHLGRTQQTVRSRLIDAKALGLYNYKPQARRNRWSKSGK